MIPTIDKATLAAGSLTLRTGWDLGWSPDSATYLAGRGLEGWFGSSPIRRNKSELLGAHGTHLERGYKDERVITANLHHVAADRAAAGLMADEMAAYLGDGEPGILKVQDASLGTRWAEVVLAGATDVVWSGGRDVSCQINMVAPDPRKYGDQVISPASGIPVPGNGLVFPLFGKAIVSESHNWALNPNGSVNAAYWNVSAGTGGAATVAANSGAGPTGVPGFIRYTQTTASTGTASSGPYYRDTSDTMTGPAGTVRYVQAWARCSVARSMRVAGNFKLTNNSDVGVALSSFVSVPANTWTYLGEVAVTATSDYSRFQAFPSTSAAIAAGETIDAVISINDAPGRPFFTGDTPNTASTSYTWMGLPGQSITTEGQLGTATGAINIGSGGYLGRASATNIGTADVGPVFTVWGDYVPGFTLTELASGRRLVYTETITTGQTLVIDSNDGSVTLDGYAPRDSKLTVSDWTRLGRGETGTWQFDSPGSAGALFTVGVTPAWW